jgi:acetamidase/formamidase/AraC-like DNA-binding protein
MTIASRLAVENFPTADRHAIWLERLARLSLSALVDAGKDLAGSLSIVPSSTGAVLALISGRAQTLRPLLQSAKHPIGILLVLRGRGQLRGERRAVELAEGDLCVADIRADWRLDWRSDFDAVLLEVPRAALVSRLGRARIDYPLALGATVAAGAARPVLRMLAANIETLQPADLIAAEIAVTELIVSALLSEIRAPEGTMTEVQSAHFRRVAAAIDGKLADADLAVAEVARQEGMSVRYVQRLFERRSESFSDYVRRRRLERCRTELSDPNHAPESVATIALRWGFRDQAHFSRAFSAAFGVAPRAVRRARAAEPLAYALRGKPGVKLPPHIPLRAPKAADRPLALPVEPARQASGRNEAHLPACAATVHWGHLGKALPPVLRIRPDTLVTIETLTQHGGDDIERMVAGDPGAESVFEWTRERKAVDRRGAGPMNASIFGRGAGEGFGVHICTGPIHVQGAEPGDILEVEILDIAARSSGKFPGKAFASNASAWWGFQYHDLLDQEDRRETVTIYEIDLADPSHATALYSYEWTPQTDPFGVVHRTIDYPGVPVDHGTVSKRHGVLDGIRIPARPHFGFVAVAPREDEIVDTIPPGYFGGNIDNWRAGVGAHLYLPVAVEGALLSIGDGHFAQADGEINGTGLECSLTGTVRIRLHKAGTGGPAHLRGLNAPLIETPTHWVVQSFSYPNYFRELGKNAQSEVYRSSTVDRALRNAFRQTRRFLMDVYGLSEDESLSLMSLAVDFGVTQVADGNFGVHATIDKSIFSGRQMHEAE